MAGGGTGGHLFPGLAIAEELKERCAETEILFVGTGEGLEARVLPREGYELRTIKVRQLIGKSIKHKLWALSQIPVALIQSSWIIFRFKPNVVVGVGGYAAGPVVLTAAFLGIPTVIHEQNVHPGFTNRVLSRFVDVVAVSFPQTKDAFPNDRAVVTGNPLRRSLLDIPEETGEAVPDGLTLLVLGGSRGARSINSAVIEALPLISSWEEPVRFIHQTGEEDHERVNAAYSSSGLRAEVRPYFQDIARCYREADLVLARAGATTLAELMACGKASILVPFAHAAGQHQKANALELKRAGAVEVVLDKDLNGHLLAGMIKKLINDSESRKYMESRLASYGRPDASARVADIIHELALKSSASVVENPLSPGGPDARPS
jgi:UDP-N-acetylglucosamine--N-acetylmuramyl-(pentapeptide) pyrophosphoryl-undecaprenol N-acetylglucosamine transferase